MRDKASTFDLEKNPQVLIRLAESGDAKSIALLCQQLGYPTSEQNVQERFKLIKNNQEHVLYIAYLPNQLIVGLIHVYIWKSLLIGRRAEIDALIVHSDFRGRGVGQLLIQHAEQWVKEQGCDTIQVRSNTVRQQAHRFYEKLGYIPIKTQLVLHKALNGSIS
ncbi:MAG: GNAT family N-acetyltransferase [Coleofasciculus sp. S288]|nr:GNAT family N-acetyltransferase [Coleofasciculus sp. S288]